MSLVSPTMAAWSSTSPNYPSPLYIKLTGSAHIHHTAGKSQLRRRSPSLFDGAFCIVLWVFLVIALPRQYRGFKGTGKIHLRRRLPSSIHQNRKFDAVESKSPTEVASAEALYAQRRPTPTSMAGVPNPFDQCWLKRTHHDLKATMIAMEQL